jgi:hypothetical protein
LTNQDVNLRMMSAIFNVVFNLRNRTAHVNPTHMVKQVRGGIHRASLF